MFLIKHYIGGKPTILYISGLFILTPTILSLWFWNTQWRRIACLASKLLKTTTTKPYPLFWLPLCPWVFLNLLSQEENKAWRATVPLYTIACWKGILLSQGDAKALETEFWLTWSLTLADGFHSDGWIKSEFVAGWNADGKHVSTQ